MVCKRQPHHFSPESAFEFMEVNICLKQPYLIKNETPISKRWSIICRRPPNGQSASREFPFGELILKRALLVVFFCISNHWALASDKPIYPFANRSCAQSAHLDACTNTRANWPNQVNAAFAGDANAQRNVASCLSTGCNGAIHAVPVDGCAWRHLIVDLQEDGIIPTDLSDLAAACGESILNDKERARALSQANVLKSLIKTSK